MLPKFMSFSQPVTLITGAARRIGACIARMLHQHHHRVIIHYHHSQHDARALCDELNRQRPDSALAIGGDLALNTQSSTLIQQAYAWHGRLDGLIHNASVFTKDEAIKTPKDWDYVFQVNVKAPYDLTLSAAPFLKESQGQIIYITDIHADQPLKHYGLYCQSKAALSMQMLSFARSLAPEIRVNAVAPGAIAWPEGDNQLPAEIQQKIIQSTLLKKHGAPKYIAHAVLSIMNNPFITGQILKVDGGRSIA